MAASLGAAVALGVLPGRAMPPLRVQSDGTCPSGEQVSAALDYLLKGGRSPSSSDRVAPDLVLSVVDLGPRYQVSIGDQIREYVDGKRDCQERARVAAVFAAVSIEPPEVTARVQPSALPPATAAPPHAHHPRFEFRVGAVSDIPVQQAFRTVAWGGELRAVLTGHHWGLELGAGGQAPIDLAWGGHQARMLRFPLDLSLRGALRGPRVTASAALGPAFAIFHLRGEGAGVPVVDGGTRLDLGVRAAVSLQVLPDARVSPFLTLHLSLWPRPYSAMVDPIGQVGTTPQVWLGATLGFSLAGP